jgi:hypothetical protein
MSDTVLPVLRSEYRLNGGPPSNFYLEDSTNGTRTKYPYGAKSAAINRLRGRPGHFNIEIAIDDPHLQVGKNELQILIEGARRDRECLEVGFDWDPRPIKLPIKLLALKGHENVQDIGQAVNGVWEVVRGDGTICANAPVGADSLFLLGSPHGSQEATYDVQFGEIGDTWSFIGLSDFFGGNEEQSPSLGIKPGYTTAGLATIENNGRAKAWISWGDCLIEDPRSWVVKTEKIVKVAVDPAVLYHVRHQVIIDDGVNVARFRIWRAGTPEPEVWFCNENTLHLSSNYPAVKAASFGLFQYGGCPTAWSNIHVRALDLNIADLRLKKRRNDRLVRAWGKTNRLIHRLVGN